MSEAPEYLWKDLPAEYKFILRDGRALKMEGIYREEIDVDGKGNPEFYLWIPRMPDELLQMFNERNIVEIRRTPIAANCEGFNLYKPQVRIFNPVFIIENTDQIDIVRMRIIGGTM